jgi:hypothetical protein
MLWIKRLIWLVVLLFIALMLLQGIASESGEVVVLSTRGSGEAAEETRLWVVDHEGHQYLRAGQPQAGWFMRLKASPRVGLERNGERNAWDAVPEPGKQAVINDLMRAKYGWADEFIGMMFGRDDATPVRLDPLPEVDPYPPPPPPAEEVQLETIDEGNVTE